jgi:hypothetical protein
MVDDLAPHAEERRDLLTLPLVGRFLHWRHSSTTMRAVVLVVALVMLVHGLSGPELAPKNLQRS